MPFNFGSTRHRRPFVLPTLLLAVALALGACGDDEDVDTSPTTPAAADGTGNDPDGVSSTTLEPQEPPVTPPDLPVNKDPSAVQCTGPPEGTFDATATVGEPLAVAEEAAAEEGCQMRVTMEDGKPLVVTQDFRPDRVNVAVEDGKVTRIESLG